MTAIVKPALDAYAADQARLFSHDRMQTIGASEIGACARKSYYTKNEGDHVHGAVRDVDYIDSYGARLRGTMMENHFWEPAMRLKYGNRLLFAGKDQQTFASGFLSATPDGMIIGLKPDEIVPGSGTEVMAECKSIDPRTNLVEAKSENVYQTQVQIGLVRELTQFKPTHSVLSYMDASFWSEVTEFVIPFDPKVFEVAKQRAAIIMTATDAHDLKPEGYIAGGRECEYCAFKGPCGIERRRVPDKDIQATLDPQFLAEVIDLAMKVKHLDIAGTQCEIELRETKEALKDRLRAKGVRKIPGVLSWSSVKGRQSWDNKAIREALIETGADISEFETVGEPTDRLVISLAP